MRTLNILFIALTILVSTSAFAAEPADREVMMEVLQSIDTVPTSAQLTERFPKGETLLVSIATSDENLYVRKRATTFLSMYRTAEAVRGLETIAEQNELRPYAVYTLARSFGEIATDALVAKVVGYLEDDSKEVREWTIRGLRWMQHADARTALEQVATESTDVELKELATRSLEKWRPAPTTEPTR